MPWVPSPRGTTWPFLSDPATHHSQDWLAACIVFPAEGTAFFYHPQGCAFFLPPYFAYHLHRSKRASWLCAEVGAEMRVNWEECMRTNSDGYPNTSSPYHTCSMSRCSRGHNQHNLDSKCRISSCRARGKFCRSLGKGRVCGQQGQGRLWVAVRVTIGQWKPGARQMVEEFENPFAYFCSKMQVCLKVDRSSQLGILLV